MPHARSRLARPVIVAALAFATAALAYVLPASSILRRVAEERDDLRLFSLRVDGTASFFTDGAREAGSALAIPFDLGEVQTDAAILFKAPGRCRLELNPQDGVKAATVLSGGKPRVEGKPIAATAVAIGEVCAFHALRSSSEAEGRAALERHLKSRGVDLTAETWLARFGSQVAYVIGKREEGAPQAWIYKDTFLPARLRYRDEAGAAWDIRFFDYTSPITGEWFPRSIEVLRDNRLVMRFTALASDARTKLDDALF